MIFSIHTVLLLLEYFVLYVPEYTEFKLFKSNIDSSQARSEKVFDLSDVTCLFPTKSPPNKSVPLCQHSTVFRRSRVRYSEIEACD